MWNIIRSSSFSSSRSMSSTTSALCFHDSEFWWKGRKAIQNVWRPARSNLVPARDVVLNRPVLCVRELVAENHGGRERFSQMSVLRREHARRAAL